MMIQKDHELHGRRLGRNIGVGLALVGFVALVFGLTVAKVQSGGELEGFDHAPRQSLVERSE